MNKMQVLVEKRRLVLVPEKREEVNEVVLPYVATVIKNLQSYGYALSESVIEVLKTLSVDEVVSFYKDLKLILDVMTGNDKITEPMYPNFPTQVMELDYIELFINAFIHYVSNGTILPEYEKEERFPLVENPEQKLNVLDLGTEEDFFNIFTNLVGAKGSISQSDKELVAEYVTTYKNDIIPYMPESITMKETLSFVTDLFLNTEGVNAGKALLLYYKTATDVLRLAVALSKGDVSLKENTKFKSFTRKERKMLLTMLDNIQYLDEDMYRYKTRWIRLGEKLHPAEYSQFKNVNKTFKKLREGEKISTFMSRLEKAYKENNVEKVVKILSSRPGEFARNLDRTIRMGDVDKTLVAFEKVAKEVATPILLQVRELFISRNKGISNEVRVFFPKGNTAKAYGIKNELPMTSREVNNKVIAICSNAIKSQFSQKEDMGLVYVNKNLNKIIVPMSQRSASKSLKTVARGSRIPLTKGTKFVRAFIHWENYVDGDYEHRTDVDLSMSMYDKNFKQVDYITYYKLRNEYGVHSGDIVDAPICSGGASEFVDLDVEKLKQNGIAYVAMLVYVYSGRPFSNINCYAGIMERTDLISGEIFEPKTVTTKADLNAHSTQVMPMIYDVEANEFVWADLATGNIEGFVNVSNTNSSIELNLRSMVNLVKPNLYDLLVLNARARGTECTREVLHPDLKIMSLEEGTQYDIDMIMADYL